MRFKSALLSFIIIMAKFFVNTAEKNNSMNITHEKAISLFSYINKYLTAYKKYPSKNFLANQFKSNTKDIIYLLEYLVGIEKLKKEKNNYYIPGKKTLSELNQTIQKEEITLTKDELIKLEKDILPIIPVKPEIIIDPAPAPAVIESKPDIEISKIDPLINTEKKIIYKQGLLKKCMSYFNSFQNLNIKFNELFFIKIVLSIMFFTSIVIEMNYNIDNFITVMGLFKGFLTGIALVLYDSIAISLIIFVLKMSMPFNNIKEILLTSLTKLFVSCILFILFIGVFYTLQINIMSGLFEKYQNKILSKEIIISKNESAILERYKQEEKELLIEHQKKILLKDKYYNEMLAFADTNSQEYKTKRYYFTIEERKVNQDKKNLDAIRSKIDNMYLENKGTEIQEKISLFDLLSKNLFKNKISSKALEVNQIFFPALIFNLISSVSLGLLLFLKEKKSVPKDAIKGANFTA